MSCCNKDVGLNSDPYEYTELCCAMIVLLTDLYCWMMVHFCSTAWMVGLNRKKGLFGDGVVDSLVVTIAFMNHGRVLFVLLCV